MKKYCLDCNKLKSQKGNYCKPCGYKHRARPSGLNYKIVAENKGWFKKGIAPLFSIFIKGHRPWNKKKKGIHLSEKSEFKKGQNVGEKNNKWKGDDVGYFALHTWVYRNLGKPTICGDCLTTQNVQWANKSHKYKRELNDWIMLCYKCHRKYDKGENWGKAARRFGL